MDCLAWHHQPSTPMREICDAILSNNELSKRFATLCDHNDKSSFTMDDSTISISFEYFLKVFGRVRGKDVALKIKRLSQQPRNKRLVMLKGTRR